MKIVLLISLLLILPITSFKALGIDLSGWDDVVYWDTLKTQVKFVILRAGIGQGGTDSVYEKYYNQIMTTTNAQTSIRTRVWDATDSENNMYIATYTPKTGKDKGTVKELIFMGKQKVLVIWLKDTTEHIKGKIYKKK